MKLIVVVVVVLICVGLFFMIKVYFGYYLYDKVIVDDVERIVIQCFNSKQFDVIYDSFVGNVKQVILRKWVLEVMYVIFDCFGIQFG